MPKTLQRWKLRRLARVVGQPADLPLPQWWSLFDAAVKTKPDLIIEIGRGYGNSTVALTEAAEAIDARVVSIGIDGTRAWENVTAPKVARVRSPDWFARLTIVEALAEETDLEPWIGESERAFLFWDAHTDELAEHLLAVVVPTLPAGSRVVVHDIGIGPPPDSDMYRYGPFFSAFSELEAIGRYADEHDVPLQEVGGLVAFTPPPSFRRSAK